MRESPNREVEPAATWPGALRFSRALVLAGTLSGPAGQFVIFWLVARAGGVTLAGQFALTLAIGTFIFAATNWGLRDSYITLKQRFAFSNYVGLRTSGTTIAVGALLGFGLLLQLPLSILAFVAAQKAADAMMDIFQGKLQRERRLGRYGLTLLANGVLSSLLAISAALIGLPPVFIISASAAGSAFTLLLCLAISRSPKSSHPRERFRLTEARLILTSSWSIGVWQLLAVAIINAPTWIVGVVGSAGDVGTFASLAYLLTAGSLAGTALSYAYIGEYRAIHDRDGSQKLLEKVRKHSVYVSTAAFLTVIGVTIFGPNLLAITFGSAFKITHLEVFLVSVAAALNPASQLVNSGLLVLNRYGRQLRISVVTLAVMALVCGASVSLGLAAVILGCVIALAGSATKLTLSVLSFKRSD